MLLSFCVVAGPEAAAASPGYSPFAGAAEPGSESPGFVAAVGGGTPATAPSSPAALPAEPAPGAPPGGLPGWQEPEAPRGHTVHGSSDALQGLGCRQGDIQRPLPRSISVDNLGTVANLGQGLPPPPVRTRPPTLAMPAPPRPQQTPAEREESSSLEGASRHVVVQASDSRRLTCLSHIPSRNLPLGLLPAAHAPAGFVVLQPHRSAWEGERTSSGEGTEEGEEGDEALFPAEDLQAGAETEGGEHVAAAWRQHRHLRTAPSASALLRDVRGIRTPQQPAAGPSAAARTPGQLAGQGPAGSGEVVPALAPGAHAEGAPSSRAASGSDELPISISPAETGMAGARTPLPPAPLAAEPAGAAATPRYRSAALSRLAQIFGGPFRWGATSGEGMPAGSLRAGSSDADAGQAGAETEAEGDEEAGTAAASAALSPSGFTPVQRYLDYRQAGLGGCRALALWTYFYHQLHAHWACACQHHLQSS